MARRRGDRMKRRGFITMLAGGIAWPLAAGAQQPMPVIGWLSGRAAETDALVLPAFRHGLGLHGYVEGRNVAVEYRYSGGQPDKLPPLIADLINRKVTVIVALGTTSG